jgi:selenide,water dikinase
LAVTGLVDNKHLKTNDGALPDCELFLTKPLGIGILTTAQKQKKIRPEHLDMAIEAMCTLNQFGFEAAKLEGVVALTDVTGFGLLGHLTEICEGSGVAAEIDVAKVPFLDHVETYLAQGCMPGGTGRNFDSYGHLISTLTEQQKYLLCDPQTSGGLLAVVTQNDVADFKSKALQNGLLLESIGHTQVHMPNAPLVTVVDSRI